MKTINKRSIALLSLMLMLSMAPLCAQDNQTRYLIPQDEDFQVSGFGTYMLGFSEVDNSFAVYNGGGGALIFNQTFFIGGYGMGLSTGHKYDPITLVNKYEETITYDNLDMDFGHGGLWLGYIHKHHLPVHVGASTRLGWGGISLKQRKNDFNQNDDYPHLSVTDKVFVINPQIDVEANMLKWFKISASAGYQFVSGIDKEYVSIDGNTNHFFASSDFSKPVFNLTFIFGYFDAN